MNDERTRPVWDLPVRLFHWLLVAAVTLAAVSGFLLLPRALTLHLIAGSAIAALLGFRLVWGFLGSTTSRFASFLYGPRAVLSHLGAVLRGRPHAHVGHNPAGSAMIWALLGVLTAMVLTGVVALGGEDKQGPLAFVMSYDAGHAVKEAHELLAWLLLALVAGHIAGVVVESLLSRENLARAMLTGRRRVPAGWAGTLRPGRAGLALGLFAALAAAVAGGTAALARLPAHGVPHLAELPEYAECGSCHWDYHPSLLPAESWRALMGTLDHHFGENAVLPPDETATITRWLTANAAGAWDTKAANRLRRVDPADPMRITASPFWKRMHGDLPDTLFQRRSIGGRGSCNACHRDADSGRFDPQAIAIPDELPLRN